MRYWEDGGARHPLLSREMMDILWATLLHIYIQSCDFDTNKQTVDVRGLWFLIIGAV
jgi:hypothetical protein